MVGVAGLSAIFALGIVLSGTSVALAVESGSAGEENLGESVSPVVSVEDIQPPTERLDAEANAQQPSPAVPSDEAAVTDEQDAPVLSSPAPVAPKPETLEAPVNVVRETVIAQDAQGALVSDGAGTRFKRADGTYATREWVTVGGSRYYFGGDGYALKSPQMVGGYLYYFDPSTGALKSGWYTGWGDGTRTYFTASGQAAQKWWSIGGKRYYFVPGSPHKAAATGKQDIDGKQYYFNSDGSLFYGLKTWADGTKSVYAKSLKGAAGIGEWTIDGKKYYFDPVTRKSVSGWHIWGDGHRSYFSTKVGYAALQGAWRIGGKAYFFDKSNKRAHAGWISWASGGRSYFAASRNYVAVLGWWTIDGKRYYFRNNLAKSNKTYSGWWRIKGTKHFFNKDGSMQTYWRSWGNGGYSYFGADGIMRTGKHRVGNMTLTFRSNGRVVINNVKTKMYVRAQLQTSPTKWLIMLDTNNTRVGIFKENGHLWNLQKYWVCTTGAYGSPWTPSGRFKIGYRGYEFGHGYSCYYYTQFNKKVLFHSVLYYKNTRTIKDGRLGYHVSAGCVRLAINNAKWIYNNIPRKTTVRVYRG